jgi:hypothetical protein
MLNGAIGDGRCRFGGSERGARCSTAGGYFLSTTVYSRACPGSQKPAGRWRFRAFSFVPPRERAAFTGVGAIASARRCTSDDQAASTAPPSGAQKSKTGWWFVFVSRSSLSHTALQFPSFAPPRDSWPWGDWLVHCARLFGPRLPRITNSHRCAFGGQHSSTTRMPFLADFRAAGGSSLRVFTSICRADRALAIPCLGDSCSSLSETGANGEGTTDIPMGPRSCFAPTSAQSHGPDRAHFDIMRQIGQGELAWRDRTAKCRPGTTKE